MDVSTDQLIRSLLIAVESRTRKEDILAISKSAANASQLKKAQREERRALTALNKHLKDCIKVVQKAKVHTYRPTRRGLKKIKGS